MIDHLSDRLPARWVKPLGAIAIVVAVGAFVAFIIAIGELLLALGLNPLVVLGWAIIGLCLTQVAAGIIGSLRRHIDTRRTEFVLGIPYWLADDWDEMCERAGLPPTTSIRQRAGAGMTTVAEDFDGTTHLLIHPHLVNQPRPLVRYALAMQAARVMAQQSTAPATVQYFIGRALALLAGSVMGVGLIALQFWLLPCTFLVILIGKAIEVTSATLGERTHLAADYIAQTHLRAPLTTAVLGLVTEDGRGVAEASWSYGRFEPDLADRVDATRGDQEQDTGTTHPVPLQQFTGTVGASVPPVTPTNGGVR